MNINRELSWIEFNQRVLNEAARLDLPVLERLKFLAISASNLDEFFQVRVGSLAVLRRSGNKSKDASGLTPNQQLTAIRKRLLSFKDEQYELYQNALLPALSEAHIRLLPLKELTPFQKSQITDTFNLNLAPLLTPLAVDHEKPELQLPPLQITIAARLIDQESGETRYAFVPIPENVNRFLSVPCESGDTFCLAEELIAHLLDDLFPGEQVAATAVFRLTRNSDIAVQEEDAIDLAGEMEDVLTARRFSEAVRLEILPGTPRDLLQLIKDTTQAGNREIYRTTGPLALNDFMSLAFLSGYDHLRLEPWQPQPSPHLDPSEPVFDTLARRDVLLYHPFESYEPVIRLLEEAATDPQTLAIKQVLYRTAKDSRIIDALIRAAENGKQVTVLVEIKARFDESRNLHRADELQAAGIQIVYGVKGLKTHAKVTLIIRNEDGRLRRYTHLGTGNYNESTARLYTDVSYLTSRPDYGADASYFFNAITGRSKLIRFQNLIPAPTRMKRRVLELIEAETEIAKSGEEAHIMAKVNSLQDPDVIDALLKAARAGVRVDLNVRGICCLRPPRGKAGQNLNVVSIIDRYLEHARIFYFSRAGDPEVYISSADWMVRNLEKRVELMIPILEPSAKRRLIKALESAFKDNTQASKLQPDGSFTRLQPGPNEKAVQFQKVMQNKAEKAAKKRAIERRSTFEPHRPQ
ncbi:MAG: polyphosphate kinase 1 [Verrucomicrobiales bacterium]